MTSAVTTAKWTIDQYHRMIEAGILTDCAVELLNDHPYPENIFWVIEYSDSSLAKDLEAKSKIYAQAQIQEYWVVNLKRMELIVVRYPTDEDYQEKRTLVEGVVTPLAFAEVAVNVDRLIRRK